MNPPGKTSPTVPDHHTHDADCPACQLFRQQIVERTLALVENVPGHFRLVMFVTEDGAVEAYSGSDRQDAIDVLEQVADEWRAEDTD